MPSRCTIFASPSAIESVISSRVSSQKTLNFENSISSSAFSVLDSPTSLSQKTFWVASSADSWRGFAIISFRAWISSSRASSLMSKFTVVQSQL